MPDDLLCDDQGPIRVLTLNRPAKRNALDSGLITALAGGLTDADADDGVAVVVLTGTDPAFCAGLDLAELGSTGRNLEATERGDDPWNVLAAMHTPVIGAVNGAAVTGGLELALRCDFLVASERARFADTHARVGAMPGGGMTGLLPQAVGIRMAKEMSLTGNFVDAATALRLRLVNRVVPHEALLPTALRLAADIAGNDREAVRRLKESYDRAALGTLGEAHALEQEVFRSWALDPAQVERRRAAVIERGRSQTPD